MQSSSSPKRAVAASERASKKRITSPASATASASLLEMADEQGGWDFEGRTQGDALESAHPYPAKFIRELPRRLISLVPPPKGTAILDPFCGSGTTLVEAQRAGFPSIGVDLNPIACLMTKVKTSSAPKDLARDAALLVEKAKAIVEPDIPSIPNLDHWFSREAQTALAALAMVLPSLKGAALDAARLALSSIIVRVSRQESDTRYAAIDKAVTVEGVFAAFLTACKKLALALAQRDYPLVPTRVIEKDVLKLNAKDVGQPVGLIITSPPYPNAYEYWLYHKYRMFWLGFDPLAVKRSEIGARAHFFKRDHHTAEHFVDQMRGAFATFADVLVPSGHVCVVVGRSIIHGKTIDNAAIIENVAAEVGMKMHRRIERKIASSRKAFNLSHANIKTETILILGQA